MKQFKRPISIAAVLLAFIGVAILIHYDLIEIPDWRGFLDDAIASLGDWLEERRDSILRIVVFLIGAFLVIRTAGAAARVVLVPNTPSDRVSVFAMRYLFQFLARRANTYEKRDRILPYIAPIPLVAVPIFWLTLIAVGYSCMTWAIIPGITVKAAFIAGSSSLLTLGFSDDPNTGATILQFTAAMLGFVLIAMINITYFPAAYNAYQQREPMVKRLGLQAGSPPSGQELLIRRHRLGLLEDQDDFWDSWTDWLSRLEDLHTRTLALVFFRSHEPYTSWIGAFGTVMDAAALMNSCVDMPRSYQSMIMLRTGYITLLGLADSLNIQYPAAPAPDDPISISRDEFDEAYDHLAQAGIPLKSDRDQCWQGFKGWRVNYDHALLGIARFINAPYAQWISDRSLPTTKN